MASLQWSNTQNLNPNFDDLKWVMHIRQTLQQELEEDGIEIPVCIFNVPKPLMSMNPDLYTPQQVAIGPYHCWRPELYEMERYKVAAAKKVQRNIRCMDVHHLVDQLHNLETRIRACYHKYLDFSGETLAWMMAIDASFLLEFLQVFAPKEGRVLTRVSSRMSHIVDYEGKKSAHNSILRDMAMLENQIPLFVVRKMLEFQFASIDLADGMLLLMLTGFCKQLSPFKKSEDLPKIDVSCSAHLLSFLYSLIVSGFEQKSEISEVDGGKENDDSSGNPSRVWKMISKLYTGPVHFFKNLTVARPVMVMLKLPWTIISSLPGFAVMKQPVEYLFFPQDNKDTNQENGTSTSTINMNKSPLVEEIAIPSVTELVKCGIRFLPINGNITTVGFDFKTGAFYLPTIELDVNTEVILRNLVAYEASNASGPLVFTRYTELMNGIIDTEDDVKLLRENEVILNHLKTDEEVANLWNGMSKSIRLTKVPFLDKVIEDVNKYYDSSWKVKFGRLMKVYVFNSWQFLIFLAAVLVLSLMAVQAYCSFYRAFRILRVKTP